MLPAAANAEHDSPPPSAKLKAVTANSKPSAPFIPTDKLELLARELFNGALPKLPADGMKRRNVLAKEFAAAHLLIPGVAKPDAAKLAALAPAFRVIAASRQAHVDAFLKTIAPKATVGSVRQQLVAVLGEQAVQLRLLNARHSIAAALVLLDRLDGNADAQLDLSHADANRFEARLDAAIPGARAHFYPGGKVGYVLSGLDLLAQLADALADGSGKPSAAQANQPARDTADDLAKQIRAESDPAKRAAIFAQLQTVWKS